MSFFNYRVFSVVFATILVAGTLPASAQDGSAELAAEDEAQQEEFLLSEEELDALTAPVALYPDSLLAQIIVASTFPIDIFKAENFIGDNPDLEDRDRIVAVQEEDWDPSVIALAGGFPTIIERMAGAIDWTEDFGNASMVQTDDVLESVQRLRTQAVELGNLESNEAQDVTIEDEQVSIAPADPEVIYVPTYDASRAYTETYTQPVTTTEASNGYSGTDLLATGALAFGSALVLNEIFDDGDDWDDDYWRYRGPSIDWDDADLYPGRNIDIDGDVNIGSNNSVKREKGDRIGNNDRDLVDRKDRDGKWKPESGKKKKAKDDQKKKKKKDKKEDHGHKVSGGKDHNKNRPGAGAGSKDRDELKRKLETREDQKRPAANLPGNGTREANGQATLPKRNNKAAEKPKVAAKNAGNAKTKSPKTSTTKNKPKAKPPKISKPKSQPKAKPSKASKPKQNASPKKTTTRKTAGKAPAKKPAASKGGSRKQPAAFKRSSSSSKARSSANRGRKATKRSSTKRTKKRRG